MLCTRSSAKTAPILISEKPPDHWRGRIKGHYAEADKVTKARAFTHQQRKSSQAEEYKSAIAEHAAIENHMLDWDRANKLEQVPDWRMKGINKPLPSGAPVTTSTALRE